jgi:hypothetical protein
VRLTNLESRYKLRQSNEEEVKIEEELELLIKHEREEREDVVFLVPDDVRGELGLHLICQMVMRTE